MNDDKLFNSILLIEDEPAHVLLIKRVLIKSSSIVTTASSVAEGVNHLKKGSFDLIITDLNLPDSKGVDHIELLIKMGTDKPVLMLTSSNSISDAVKAMRLGASDFIVKNFDDNFEEMFGLALARVHAAQELRLQKKKLEREMAALRVAVENGQDGMSVVSSKGEFHYQNSSFQNLINKTGGTEGSLFDALGSCIKGQEKLIEDLKGKLLSLSPGAVWSTEILIKEEIDNAFDLHLSVIDLDVNQTNRCVVWIRDVSERKRRERFQKEILSTTTHDLKGPLGAIALCAEMLHDMVPAPEKAQQLIMRINSSSRGAISLIDEFLSARRIQEGTFVLQPAKQDAIKIVQSVVDEYKAVSTSREINLKFIAVGKEKEACIDGLALTRVVGNLVSNALKFTPANGTVSVESTIVDGSLTITVTDTGSGMEPSEVQRIFERYSRLSKHTGIQGTGLGLYVVKNIVTSHGGAIEVTSQPGEGSSFRISFPAEPPVNDKGQILCLDFA